MKSNGGVNHYFLHKIGTLKLGDWRKCVHAVNVGYDEEKPKETIMGAMAKGFRHSIRKHLGMDK